MKPPKRTQKAIETIEQMIEWLDYFMGNTREFREFVRKDVKELEEYLTEVSTSAKLNNIRLAKRLKALWKQEMVEKDQQIEELEAKLLESERE